MSNQNIIYFNKKPTFYNNSQIETNQIKIYNQKLINNINTKRSSILNINQINYNNKCSIYSCNKKSINNCNYCNSPICINHSLICINCKEKMCNFHWFICNLCQKNKNQKLCIKNCLKKCNNCNNEINVLCEEINHKKNYIKKYKCQHYICNQCLIKCKKCSIIIKECPLCNNNNEEYQDCKICNNIYCNNCCNICLDCNNKYCPEFHICEICNEKKNICSKCEFNKKNKCKICKEKLKICGNCINRFICSDKCYTNFKNNNILYNNQIIKGKGNNKYKFNQNNDEHICDMYYCKEHFITNKNNKCQIKLKRSKTTIILYEKNNSTIIRNKVLRRNKTLKKAIQCKACLIF
jgi:hypothetical protein